MEVRILGPLEVLGDQGAIPLPRGRVRALLAQLALRVGEVISADRLIDELWGPSPPPTAHTALQVLISKLRRRIEPDAASPAILVTRAPGYALRLDREQVDAHRFRIQVAEAVGAEPSTRAVLLREALGLWRGPALHDFTYEPFAQAAIADLSELRLTALEERVEADLALGRHRELVAELESLAAEHSLRERLVGQLMLALYRCGRQADALKVYRRTRQRLVEDLGIEPGHDLQQLQRAMLSQAPAVAAPAAAAPPTDRRLAGRTAPTWLAGGRRIVTTVFADLSVAGPAVDPETSRPATRRAYEIAAEVVNRHGGTIEGFLGDVVVAVFGVPLAHEDDALRAVRAGHELCSRLAAAEAEPGIPRPTCRIGISTGEVVVGGAAGPTMSGQPVTVAARLQQMAADGEVLVGAETLRLVGPQVRAEPVVGPVRAWRVSDLVGWLPVAATEDSLHVGRGADLVQLRQAYQRSVEQRHAVLVTVTGEAGIGKSRLAREFTRIVAPAALVATGHCPSYGEGITFWPLREIMQSLAPDRDLDRLAELFQGVPAQAASAALVASAVGPVTGPGRPGELFHAVRTLFEAVARQRPLVLIFEDLHWAQPTLLDLIEHLAESSRHPLLLLCLTRPELIHDRPGWPGEAVTAVAIRLAPLTPPESEQLLRHRQGGHLLPSDAARRVIDLAQGNPLFLEQLLAALREDPRLEVPPTLQALLTARLDRLGPAERDLLRCASVAGVEVSVGAIAALLPEQAQLHLRRHLQAVAARELITVPASGSGQPPAFRFRHVLIQRAAYRTLTRQTRAEMHERYANWLTEEAQHSQGDLDELVGHHLEQAFRHRQQLGQGDAAGPLARQAGERLAEAGLRAYARFDVPAAENLLSRARTLLPADHPARPEVVRRLTEAYPVMGKPDQAEAAFAELLGHLAAGEDDTIGRAVRLERARFRLITGPDPVALQDIRDEAERALVYYRRRGDDVGISRACYVLACVHLRAGRVTALAEAAQEGFAHAERSSDTRERLGTRWWPVYAVLAGPAPVPEGIRTCEELVDVGGIKHPGALAGLALLAAMTGDMAGARATVAEARQIVREQFRLPRPLIFIGQCQAAIEQLAGDDLAAEQALRFALDLARQVCERDDVCHLAANLSLLLSRHGEVDEAAAMAALASEQAPAESMTAQLLARAATARSRLDTGARDSTVQLIRDTTRGVPADMLTLAAQLNLVAAEIVAAAGERDAAAHHRDAVEGLYRRKGNVAGARQLAATCAGAVER